MNDAATVAASIDIATVDGWNLRALLLRLLDGTRHDAPRGLWAGLSDLGLIDDERGFVTPLGREVAEQLRPKPWKVTTDRGFPRLLHPNGDFAFEAAGELDLCRRIAKLLDADDEREVKRYKETT